MVHRNNNRNSFNMFQHYSSHENKKLQHELEKNGRTIEQSSEPLFLGKGAQDYKNSKSHHMNRKIFAVIIPCAIVVIALVVIGAFSSYHRDAPSTTTPEVSTQAKTQKKPKRKIKKVHKIKQNPNKKTQPKDNVVTVFQNKASTPKKSSTKKSATKQSTSEKTNKPSSTSIKRGNTTSSTSKDMKATTKQKSNNSQSNKSTNQQSSHSNSLT